MAIQTIKHGFPFPAWPTVATSNPGISGFAIDAAGEKAAAIIVATAAKSIHKIHYRTVVVTTGDTIDCRVETVSAANGDPTGTLWATDTNGASVLGSGDDDSWKVATLTADAPLAVGDVVALVLANGGAGGDWQVAYWAKQSAHFPYGDHFTSAWAKQTAIPLIVAEYSDGSFEPCLGYFDAGGPLHANTFNSGSASNRYGNIFQLPFPTRASGCWWWGYLGGAATIKLYDTDGSTVLATTAALDPDQKQTASYGVHFVPFTSPATLSANSNYRLAIVPSTVTDVISWDFDVPAAGMLDMFPGGQACHASIYTTGAWVETTTRRGYLGLVLDGFADDAGGGGGGPLLNGRLIQ